MGPIPYYNYRTRVLEKYKIR
nr:envelope membrane protein [Stemona tuberosa]